MLIKALLSLDPVEQVTLRCVLEDKVEEALILKAGVETEDVWVFELTVDGNLTSENMYDLVVLNLV